jgi:hypothetical protein
MMAHMRISQPEPSLVWFMQLSPSTHDPDGLDLRPRKAVEVLNVMNDLVSQYALINYAVRTPVLQPDCQLLVLAKVWGVWCYLYVWEIWWAFVFECLGSEEHKLPCQFIHASRASTYRL